MALPRSIQNQVAQADATLAAYAAQAPEAVAQTEPIDIPVVVASPPVEAPPAPAPAPVAPPEVSQETWEHKFRSLQGIFNKNVPELQGQVKELTRRLDAALQTLESERTSKAQPQEAPKQVVDPKDVENFGGDLVEMVQRITDAKLGHVAQLVDAKVAELEKMMGSMGKQLEGTTQTVAVSAEQAFFDKLSGLMPSWEATNADPAFLAWLAASDPVYGVPRQAALDRAREALDVGRAVSVFRAFAPAAPTPVASNAVDRQVSPKAGASSAPPVSQSKPMYSQKQVTDFYNDMARGKFRGRDAEAQVIEQSVNLAIAEGRVR